MVFAHESSAFPLYSSIIHTLQSSVNPLTSTKSYFLRLRIGIVFSFVCTILQGNLPCLSTSISHAHIVELFSSLVAFIPNIQKSTDIWIQSAKIIIDVRSYEKHSKEWVRNHQWKRGDRHMK